MDPYSIQTTQSLDTVSKLMEKYKDDPYMFSKIHNYVCFQLPNIIENIKRTYIERQQRIAELTVEQDGFIDRFLNAHRYFYVSTTEKFVSYNGIQYEVKTEDSILHHILTTITSNESQLMDWKQRTKVYLMKRIKENFLIKSVPESETIQYVLENIHPVLFETKEEAKYFLTILGDNILRKRGDTVHFISAKAKVFLRELSYVSTYLFGVNATTTFKHKYYDHEYDRCRLVKVSDSIESEHIWGKILQAISIDLLCVACHYSIRYGSSDEYVVRFSNQDTLETFVFYLKNNSQDQLVSRFISEYLQVSLNGTTTFVQISPGTTPGTTPPTTQSNLALSLSINATGTRSLKPGTHPVETNTSRHISWKNMHYLWRHFLNNLHLPTIMFQQDLKNKLTSVLSENYKEETETFIGVSSKYMPYIRSFIHFWEITVEYDESGEYEMDELCMLYKTWLVGQCKNQNANLLLPSGEYRNLRDSGNIHAFQTNVKENTLNEKQMLDLILYYFPHIEIEKEKYVYKIRSTLWDKQLDIQTALEQLKEDIREKNATSKFTGDATIGSIVGKSSSNATSQYATSIYDAYIWYCKYYSDLRNGSDKHPIVSKSYFEKYIMESIGIYVIDDKYLSNEWVNQ